jgi:autonomous glycyl radical cofactor GrcA
LGWKRGEVEDEVEVEVKVEVKVEGEGFFELNLLEFKFLISNINYHHE